LKPQQWQWLLAYVAPTANAFGVAERWGSERRRRPFNRRAIELCRRRFTSLAFQAVFYILYLASSASF